MPTCIEALKQELDDAEREAQDVPGVVVSTEANSEGGEGNRSPVFDEDIEGLSDLEMEELLAQEFDPQQSDASVF